MGIVKMILMVLGVILVVGGSYMLLFTNGYGVIPLFIGAGFIMIVAGAELNNPN